MNRWVVENKIWPMATLIGEEKCKKLIKAVAASHTAVARGSKNSWTILKVGILNSLSLW